MSKKSAKFKVLGDSIFSYKDYSVYRFLHYYQQISYVLPLKPNEILEIGPGDHTITDFLRRKGIKVDTMDNDPQLHPDFLHDIRNSFPQMQKWDLVLASEVFEHMNIKFLSVI